MPGAPRSSYVRRGRARSAPRRSQGRVNIARMAMVPGYSRTSGYYGRFSGPNAEKKFLDTDVAAANITVAAGAIVDSVNKVAQGDTESERIGRKIVVKSLHMKTTLNTSATDPDGVFRMIIYVDSQANGAAAAVTDILEAVGVNEFRNLANSQRFRVLHDRTYTLNATSNVGNAATFPIFRKHFIVNKNLNVPVEFDNSATTGAITTIRSNNIGVLYLVDGGPADTWDITGNVRIRYTDR